MTGINVLKDKKMNKISKFLALGLLSLTALTSCDKKEDLASKEVDLNNNEKVSYVSSLEVKSFGQLDHTQGDAMRAIVRSNGYAVPTLDINKAEFEGSDKHYAHWSVLGGNQHETASTATILDEKPNSSPGNALYIGTSTPKVLNMYCDISLSNVSQKSAMFALGGVLSSNEKYLEFMGEYHSPNAKIQGIELGQEQVKRHIPLMTKVMPFNKLLAPAGTSGKVTAKFELRGALVGLCFVNRLDKKVSIKKIILEKDNALYFEGKFALQESISGKNFLTASSPIADEAVKFYGEKVQQDIEAPIVASKALDVVPSSMAVDDRLKNNLPLYHIWGMPKDKTKKLKIKLVLTKEGDPTELRTKSFEINTPKTNGFEEGKAYRVPLLITPDMLQGSTPTPPSKNPLAFVGEFVVNHKGDDFVKHYNLPAHTAYSNLQDSDAGYYRLEDALKLFDGSKNFLKDYYFPNVYQWSTIFPLRADLVQFKTAKRTSDNGYAQFGEGGISQRYDSDYISIGKKNRCHVYALRFKGTEWESAWHYYEDHGDYSGNQFHLVVECVGGLKGSGKTLDDIAKPEFFTGNSQTITRRFPAYGLFKSIYSGLKHKGIWGRYWSSKPATLGGSGNGAATYFDSYNSEIRAMTASFRTVVLPFKKNP